MDRDGPNDEKRETYRGVAIWESEDGYYWKVGQITSHDYDSIHDCRASIDKHLAFEKGVSGKDFIGGEPISEPGRVATVAAYEPWTPISDPVDLKHLGKLGEEGNELGGIVCRIIIQGMDAHNKKEGQSNRLCLEGELGDVLANAELVIDRFGLDKDRIRRRADEKKPLLIGWHSMAGETTRVDFATLGVKGDVPIEAITVSKGVCSCGGNPHTTTCPMKPQKDL